MKTFKDSRGLRKVARGPVLTLGNFDGVHLGHRRIIRALRERAALLGCPSAVYTFEPHPLKVVAPHLSPPLIVDVETKKEIIASLGVDYMVIAEFTRDFAAKDPRSFVEEEIVPLKPREVLVGHDFSFGKAKSGTVEFLAALGREHGFSVHVIPAYKRGGQVVSSSRVRRLVGEGRLGEAALLLGRRFSIKGRVVRGTRVGHGLGYPTANVVPSGELVPADGVYAAFAVVGSSRHEAVVNIGLSPTFGGRVRRIEAHMLGFKGDVYGKKIQVEFVRRLRGERAFKTKEALARQIAKDVERARALLAAKG